MNLLLMFLSRGLRLILWEDLSSLGASSSTEVWRHQRAALNSSTDTARWVLFLAAFLYLTGVCSLQKIACVGLLKPWLWHRRTLSLYFVLGAGLEKLLPMMLLSPEIRSTKLYRDKEGEFLPGSSRKENNRREYSHSLISRFYEDKMIPSKSSGNVVWN